jgi:uncharacterized membrane protein HdeD (DUF308 family)
MLALRGLAAIVFGVLAFVWPDITLFALVLLFGAYMLVDGIFAIVAAVRAAGREARWWLLLIEGVLGVLAGLVAAFWPGLTALALLYFIAAWAIVSGILEIVAALRLRREIEGGVGAWTERSSLCAIRSSAGCNTSTRGFALTCMADRSVRARLRRVAPGTRLQGT